jgi:hypothetical protein
MHVWSGRLTEFAWWVAVGVCCAWLVGRWILRRIKRRGNRLSEDEPRCARCGYIILPGASSICPECGADVRESGLVTPSTPMPSTSMPWVVLAVLLAWPAARWLAPHIAERQPFGWAYSATRRIQLSGTSATAYVQSWGTGRYWSRTPHLIQARIHNGPIAGAPYLLIKPRRMESHLSDGRTRNWELNYDEQVVTRLASLAGFDPDTPTGRQISGQILREVDAMWAGQLPSRSPEDDDDAEPLRWGNTGVHYRLRYRVEKIVGIVIWAILSAFAMILGAARHRLLRKKAAAAQTAVVDQLHLVPPLRA